MQKYRRVKRNKKNAGKNVFTVFIIILTIVLIASLIRLYIRTDVGKINEDLKVERTTQTVQNVTSQDTTIEDIIEEVNHSVVGISKIKEIGSSIFTQDGIEKLGLGTGVIVSSNGYIITNKHVSGDRYSSCYVTLENGNTYDANVVWADATLDLSIVKIKLEGLQAVKLGDSTSVKAGQTVYAIGNPIGFEFRRTVTSGIISAKNRSIKIEEENNQAYMSDLIQTDATINPGNSGGPLIAPNGEVVGINTVKISTAEGIGFAIPVNVVKTIIESYKQTDSYEQATLGIYAYDKDVIPYLDTNIKFEKGIYVAQITPKGAAEGSGLEEKDIIQSIDEKELNTMNDLREYIYTKKPGDQVTLKIIRKKITKNINITLGKK